MTQAKRHLVHIGRRVACGVVNPPLTTKDPAQVTCGACRRTVAMADAEIMANRKRAIRPIK